MQYLVPICSMGLLLTAAGCASMGGGPRTPVGQHPQSLEKDVRLKVGCNYLLYLPERYYEDKKDWPLVLFLHGAGERGDNLDLVKVWGPPQLVAEGREYPFILVSPQCPAEGWWSDDVQAGVLDALLDDVAGRYRVDKDRVYVTGLSMGGFGTWRLAVDHPDRFAAIIPVCGKGEPAKAQRIKDLPVWVFHGADDDAVPLSGSQDMVDALKACGSNVKFTIYPNTGHNCWSATYANPEVYDWLLSQKRRSGR